MVVIQIPFYHHSPHLMPYLSQNKSSKQLMLGMILATRVHRSCSIVVPQSKRYKYSLFLHDCVICATFGSINRT